MDIVLDKLSCDTDLPFSIVESTFKLRCNTRKRCSLQGDTGLAEGQFILNGIQNTEIKYGQVYFSGTINTESLDFEFRGDSGNLCKLAVAENLYGEGDNGDDDYQDDGYNANDDENNRDNSGDDNYQDDGYYKNDDAIGDDGNQGDGSYKNGDDAQCVLEDGVYGFSTEITIPSYEGRWSDTGWKATGQLDIYTYGMEQIGSCEASVRLLSPIGPSAKTLFDVVLPMIGVALIAIIITLFGKRMVIHCNRDLDCSKCGSRKSISSKESRNGSSRRNKKLQNDGATTSGTQETGASKAPVYQLMLDDSTDWVGKPNKRDIARLVLV